MAPVSVAPIAQAEPSAPRKGYQISLTQQILLGLVLGVLLGWYMNRLPAESRAAGEAWVVMVREIFLHLIKCIVVPLIFAHEAGTFFS